MLRAKGLFPDRQRPLVKGLGLRVLALVVVEPREVVEAGGHSRDAPGRGPFPGSPAPACKAARPARTGLGCQ